MMSSTIGHQYLEWVRNMDTNGLWASHEAANMWRVVRERLEPFSTIKCRSLVAKSRV